MIAPDVIDRVRERTNLREIVAQSVKLERRGRSWIGLCPFHKEKTPSFHVHEDRGFFHCFGCGASGDVFKFLMEQDGLTFIEAVRALGERLGIEIRDDLSEEEQRRRKAHKKREDELYNVGAVAAAYFETMLRSHPRSGLARSELERRGLPLSEENRTVLAAFRVGYAPDGWDGLATHLKEAGIHLRAAEEIGLIAPRKQGSGHYDRFRHRLMFAVLDLHGRIIAFSGRALPEAQTGGAGEEPAKYINSPESPIYKKREAVFGLYQARSALRAQKPCLIVEGNFDVVSLHARGLANTVAPLGTAFTVEQARLIRRFSTEVVLLFDGDNAGRKATKASREPCQEAGLSVRVASLPEGTDPDELCRRGGAEAILRLSDSAPGMLDYLVTEALDERFLTTDAQALGKKVNEVVQLITAEKDPTVRALAEKHADQLAARLGVADVRTFQALQRAIRRGLAAPSSNDGASAPASPSRSTAPPAPTRSGGRGEIEKRVLGALLDYPLLLDSEELRDHSAGVQGSLALAIAVLRRALVTPGASLHPTSTNLHRALAKIPEELRPFAESRVAAPALGTEDIARRELILNLKKLLQLEHSRMSQTAALEIERARLEGNVDQELELLRAHELRARTRRGI